MGIAVVGTNRHALVRSAKFSDRPDRLRQTMPWRGRRSAAQEQPDAGFQQVIRNLAIDRLVRIGDAGCGIGRDEFAAVDMS